LFQKSNDRQDIFVYPNGFVYPQVRYAGNQITEISHEKWQNMCISKIEQLI